MRTARSAQPKRRREENGEKSGFKKKDVPLVAKEDLRQQAKGEIQHPEQGQTRRGSNADDHQQREPDAGAGLKADKTLTGANPAEGGNQSVTFDADVLLVGSVVQ